MAIKKRRAIAPGWWALVLVATVIGITAMTVVLFTGDLKTYVPVTLRSDRAGLVMDVGAKVRLRGAEVGQVGDIDGQADGVSLGLKIDPDAVRYIPANVEARIRATTAFGAKYVDLVVPGDPTAKRLAAGAVITSGNVSTEVNTVFENLTQVLKQIDPAKLNGVLGAFAEGLRGQGTRIGEGITDGNEVLMALNPRAETIRADYRAFKAFNDTYSSAAQNILSFLDAASTTSTTITGNQQSLDALLLSTIGFARSGIDLIGPSKGDLIKSINTTEPTAQLLMKYNPELTCLLVGGKTVLDQGFGGVTGGTNGYSAIVDAGLLFGDDAYHYPENLPVVGAKGGPGGKPGCGSLPDVSKNWPQRYLVTNTGWGTGTDVRVNPGVGHPFYANYLPVTRGTPEPPSIRGDGPTAPGPIPYPGAPAYGAPLYAPDGTPLYPGLPPAAPPGAPREPGATPGSEPMIVPNPAENQPTPGPPPPEVAAPSP